MLCNCEITEGISKLIHRNQTTIIISHIFKSQRDYNEFGTKEVETNMYESLPLVLPVTSLLC